MDCSNHTVISKYVSKCSILDELGVNYIPGPNRSGGPCSRCKKEWDDNRPPTKDTLTPSMKMVLQSNSKISLPTITEQAVSFVSAVTKWAFTGFSNLPDGEYNLRVQQCKKNECGMYDEINDRCLACSCKIQDEGIIPMKARFSSEDCPAGLWNRVPTEYINQPSPGKCGTCGQR